MAKLPARLIGKISSRWPPNLYQHKKNLCVSGWDKCQDLCQRPTLAAMPLSANTLLPRRLLPVFTIRNQFWGLWLLHKVLRFGVHSTEFGCWRSLLASASTCPRNLSGYKARGGPRLRLPIRPYQLQFYEGATIVKISKTHGGKLDSMRLLRL